MQQKYPTTLHPSMQGQQTRVEKEANQSPDEYHIPTESEFQQMNDVPAEWEIEEVAGDDFTRGVPHNGQTNGHWCFDEDPEGFGDSDYDPAADYGPNSQENSWQGSGSGSGTPPVWPKDIHPSHSEDVVRNFNTSIAPSNSHDDLPAVNLQSEDGSWQVKNTFLVYAPEKPQMYPMRRINSADGRLFSKDAGCNHGESSSQDCTTSSQDANWQYADSSSQGFPNPEDASWKSNETATQGAPFQGFYSYSLF